jgi:cytochrome P450
MTARQGLSSDVLERDLSGSPRGGGSGFWALTRMDDIREVSRRPDDFCSGNGINIFDQPPGLKDYRGSFIDMDNPEHARLRRIVSRGFAAKSLAAITDDVDRAAREIIGSVADRGECDFVTEVAALLPLRIVNNMLGIPRSEERFIFEQTNVIMAASDSEYVSDQTPRGIARAVGTAGQRLAELLHGLADDRISSPRGDLISVLVAATAEDNLTPDELAAFFILLVGAGNETTRNAIAHGLLALTQFPDQRALWQGDPAAHTARAVEEVVRWASPVLHMRRTVTRDGVRLGDQEFAQGDKVVLWYRSANQDEDYFTDPTAFDITREPNPRDRRDGAQDAGACPRVRRLVERPGHPARSPGAGPVAGRCRARVDTAGGGLRGRRCQPRGRRRGGGPPVREHEPGCRNRPRARRPLRPAGGSGN